MQDCTLLIDSSEVTQSLFSHTSWQTRLLPSDSSYSLSPEESDVIERLSFPLYSNNVTFYEAVPSWLTKARDVLSSTLPPVSLAANLILPFGYPMAAFALDSLRAHLTLVSVFGNNHIYPLSTSALRLILMKSSLLAKLFETDTT
jgi:hypothetical protein